MCHVWQSKRPEAPLLWGLWLHVLSFLSRTVAVFQHAVVVDLEHMHTFINDWKSLAHNATPLQGYKHLRIMKWSNSLWKNYLLHQFIIRCCNFFLNHHSSDSQDRLCFSISKGREQNVLTQFNMVTFSVLEVKRWFSFHSHCENLIELKGEKKNRRPAEDLRDSVSHVLPAVLPSSGCPTLPGFSWQVSVLLLNYHFFCLLLICLSLPWRVQVPLWPHFCCGSKKPWCFFSVFSFFLAKKKWWCLIYTSAQRTRNFKSQGMKIKHYLLYNQSHI